MTLVYHKWCHTVSSFQNAITAAGHFTSLLVETLISVMFAVTMYCALQDESWGVWARVFGFMGRSNRPPCYRQNHYPRLKLMVSIMEFHSVTIIRV